MGERFQRTTSASPTKGEVLRVKRVKVEGLFGLYNHDIPLNAEERVTIVHGPNGVGKTVLLKMIAAVFGGHYEELEKVRFKKFDLELSDGPPLSIESIEPLADTVLPFERYKPIAIYVSLGANSGTFHVNNFARLDDDGNTVIETRAVWTSKRPKEDPATVIRPSFLHAAVNQSVAMAEPEWFKDFCNRLDVHLIETQRLLRATSRDERGDLVPTVREYARDLHDRITEALAGYAMASQSIDQSFPQRLLKTKGKSIVSPLELDMQLRALNAARANLEKIGLLDLAASSPFEIENMDASDPVQSNVMSLYIEDSLQKLSELDDIARRITLLLEYVNGKFRNKSIQIRREEGFVVLGHDGVPIEPDSLSSGEQHELVQLYDLLFRVKPGTLVLIDEPEISLHILWQKKYLEELIEIAKTADFDAIVATHSPFIVGDRSDLMVPLMADIDA